VCTGTPVYYEQTVRERVTRGKPRLTRGPRSWKKSLSGDTMLTCKPLSTDRRAMVPMMSSASTPLIINSGSPMRRTRQEGP